MPVLEQLSAEYEDQVTFLAVAARGDADATAEAAAEWIPSGRVKWAFDEPERLWGVFGARGTPTTVVITADGVVIGAWPGAIGVENMQSAVEQLIASGS